MNITFTSLPVEIQRECANYLDAVALKSMRLTSRAIKDVVTEALFKVALLQFTKQSAEMFTQLAVSKDLRCYVRKLHVDTDPDHDISCISGDNSVPDWWTEAFVCGTFLPKLQELILEFPIADVESHTWKRSQHQIALKPLTVALNINTLTIKHLQDSCLVNCPDLKHFHAKISKLHLLIATESDEACSENDLEIGYRHSLFNKELNALYLTPIQSHITHLTLHCNTYWGVYPRWQPADLHFPHLKSMSFGNWTIAFDWQIDFITSHGQTLEQLILSNCPVLHALRMTERQFSNQWTVRPRATGRGHPPLCTTFSDLRWHTVLPEFKTKLTKLKHFSMGRETLEDDEAFEDRYRLPACIDSSRYAIFDFLYGPAEWVDLNSERGEYLFLKKSRFMDSTWLTDEADEGVRGKVEYPDCWQEDQEALEDLLKGLMERV